MDDRNDQESLAALRRGDRIAFRSLVHEHQDRVYAFALRLLGDQSDAMELTQDVFVAAWHGADTFRGDSGVSTWLHGIAVRLAKQRWRRRDRRERRERRYAEARFDDAVRRAMPDARIDLERALQELPPRQRAAVTLHCIVGHSQKEVAEIMGIAEGTVKAHVYNGRHTLKSRLEP